MMRDLLNFIFNIINDIIKYREIRDSEKKETSIRFGIGAIITSLLIPLGIFILIISYQSLQSGNVEVLGALASIFGIILGVVIPLVALIRGTVYVILQLRLNRKPIGWIALVIYVLAFVATILLITSKL